MLSACAFKTYWGGCIPFLKTKVSFEVSDRLAIDLARVLQERSIVTALEALDRAEDSSNG